MRIRAFMMALLLLVMVCVGRAVQLQALEAQSFAAQAAEKMQNTRELLPERRRHHRPQRGGARHHPAGHARHG